MGYGWLGMAVNDGLPPGCVERRWTGSGDGGGSFGEPAVHDFDGVEGVDAGAVEDLLAAGGAWSGDEGGGDVAGVVVRGGDGTAQRGEVEHLADGDGGVVVFFLVAS